MIRYTPTHIPAARSKELLCTFAQCGCERSFAELVELHRPMVVAVCLKIIRNHADADDAAQAVFLTLAMEVRGGTQIEHLTGWLRQVARRVALDQYRAKARRRKRECDATLSDDSFTNDTVLSSAAGKDLPNEVEQQELREILQKALNDLPAKYRSAMVLFYFGGLSLPEIAKQLNVRAKTLGVRLLRARRMLATRLSKTQLGASLCASGLFVHSRLHELLTQAVVQQQGGIAGSMVLPTYSLSGFSASAGFAHEPILVGSVSGHHLDLAAQVLPVVRLFRKGLSPRNFALVLATTSLTGAGVAGGVKAITGNGLDFSGTRDWLLQLNPGQLLDRVPVPQFKTPQLPVPSISQTNVTEQPAEQHGVAVAEHVPFDARHFGYTPRHLQGLGSSRVGIAQTRSGAVLARQPDGVTWSRSNQIPQFILPTPSAPQEHINGSDFNLIASASRNSGGSISILDETPLANGDASLELAMGVPEADFSMSITNGLDSRSKVTGSVASSDLGDFSGSLPTVDPEAGLPLFEPNADLFTPPWIQQNQPSFDPGTGGLISEPVGGSPIPEPGVMLFVAGSCGALLARNRRRVSR
jgi:RNA polymerase sigma factor (sigma-70 family)